MIMETRSTLAILDEDELIMIIGRYDYLCSVDQMYFEVVKFSDGLMDFVRADRISNTMFITASNSQLN